MACSSCSGSNAISIPLRSIRSTSLPKATIAPQRIVSTYNLSDKHTISIKNANDKHRA